PILTPGRMPLLLFIKKHLYYPNETGIFKVCAFRLAKHGKAGKKQSIKNIKNLRVLLYLCPAEDRYL
ncbi:MAG TPA: hypothetical protein VFF09_04425, partial [archaeon]|nr:hypothetical protein [archaeon]